MKTIHWPKTVGVLFMVLATLGVVYAQTFSDNSDTPVLTDPNTDVSGLSDEAVELKALEAANPTPATALPRSGTYWSAQHAPGTRSPWPPLPGDPLNLAAWPLGDGNVFILNDLNVDYAAVAAATSANPMRTLVVGGPPFPGGTNSGTNVFIPNDEAYPPPDYGTNLYISQWSLSNNVITGVASNTLADVTYQLQAINSLTQSNGWINVGDPIVGSETTNWTLLNPVAVDFTSSRFYRLQSEQSSDGSGIPDWWETEYGLTGVDPNSFDAAGDGWTIYQKYVMGVSPYAWVVPPAPQGLTVSYDAGTGTATVTWLPSPGNVTGYVLTTPSGTITLPANTTSYADIDPNLIIGLTPSDYPDEFYNTSFDLAANYAGGISPAATINLQGGWPFPPNVWLVQGAQGSNFLAVSALPPDTAAIRLLREDQPAEVSYGDYSLNVSNDIPLAAFTNGLFYVPPGLTTAPIDAYGNEQYVWWAQPVNASGGANSPGVLLGNNSVGNADYGVIGINPLYLDGRVQMKQDLAFQLRMATEDYPFGYYNDFYESFNYPTNYAFQGFYEPSGLFDSYSDPIQAGTFDPFLPFENNYFYYNFVFNLSQTDQGAPTTGVGSYDDLTLAIYQPTNVFQPPNASGTPVPALLGTDAPWLVTAAYTGSTWLYTQFNEIGVSRDGSGNYHLGGVNYFGLPFLSVEIAYPSGSSGTATTILDAGGSTQQGGYFYPQTAQPEFQTLEYDFWNASGHYDVNDNWQTWDLLPGMDNFSPTNQSDRALIVGLGSSIQVAGYAKEAVVNGYPGVYGYLGQYFDQAYAMDTNGNVTTTPTGVLSPYGTFFPTQPGQAALVTMPDLDTGQRGTGVVNVISLTVDKNHDGTMDTSFAGQDATSQASPMECWVNDDCDWSYYTGDVGKDIPCTSKTYDYLNQNIISQRDLEDWFRLWICGVPVLTNGFQVTLSWVNVSSGSPAVNLVHSVETDGGTGYLTDTNVAAEQATGSPSAKFARITTSQPYTFPNNYFDGANKHLLFEGAGIGAGELAMTITDANGNQIAQTGVWLDLHDVKNFYERTVITNDMSGSISNWTSGIEVVEPAISNMSNDTNLIVFVHGFNVGNWNWLVDSDTVFKRLYWAGYNGKFMTVKWPAIYFDTSLSSIGTDLSENVGIFNDSEVRAYKSSQALTVYLNDLRSRFPNDRLNILAHSQGNVVVSEAIEQGAPFDTYILTQAAMPDSAYDENAPTNAEMAAYDTGSKTTPDSQPMGYHGIYTNFTGNIVNFYNPQDGALSKWITDQEYFKPSYYISSAHYFYDGTNSYYFPAFGTGYTVTDSEESRAEVARSRTLPIGQSDPASAHGVISSAIDLNAQFGFSRQIDDHSAQWTWPIQKTSGYYLQILNSINP